MFYSMKEAQNLCKVSRKAIRYYEEVGLVKLKHDFNKITIDEENLSKLKKVCYFRELGIDTSIISDLVEYKDCQRIVCALDKAYTQLLQDYEEHEKYLDAIEKNLDNLRSCDESLWNDDVLLKLQDNNCIVDTVMSPVHSVRSYYRVQEVTFSKRQYRVFRLLVNGCVLCTFFILVCLILSKILEVKG